MSSAPNRSSALQCFECSNSMMKSGLLFECEPLSLTSTLSMHPSLVPRTLSILCSIGIESCWGSGNETICTPGWDSTNNCFGQMVVCVVHGIAMQVYEGVTWSIKQVHLYIHLYIMSSFFFSQALFYESLDYFVLVGIVCGLAIYNSVIIDLPFPTALYKKLLQRLVMY